ncbi:MAG: type IV pilus secretin PilQ [Acidobacteriota bacterium]|nr:type IV pilus secretin PilQ [Acidobacteriota bacterium]
MLTLLVPQFANTQDRPRNARPTQIADTGKASAAKPAVGTELPAVPGKASPSSTAPASLTDVQVSSEGGLTTVTIVSNQPVTPQKFQLNNPRRLVLDFPNSKNEISAASFPVGDASVKQLRVRQFQTEPSPIVRMVFDLQDGSQAPDVAIGTNQVKVSFNNGQAAAPVRTAAMTTGAPLIPAVAKGSDRMESADAAVALPGIAPAQTFFPVADSAAPAAPAAPIAPATKVDAAPSKPAQEKPALIAALAAATSPVTRSTPAAASRFTGQPLTLDLVKVPLVDFFRLMADEGGVNIVLDPAVKGEVTIKVVKMPWDQIFEAVMANNGLDKQVDGAMIRVASKATLQDEAKQKEALQKATMLAAELETRIKRLNYAKAKDLKDSVKDQKSPRGTIVVDERTNSLILTDVASYIDKQIKLIEALDIPQAQVEIEARIVEATRNFSRDIGVQFGFVQGNGERVSVGGPAASSFAKNGGVGTRPGEKPVISDSLVGTGSDGENNNLNVNLPAKTAFGGIGISVGNIFDTFLLDAAITAGESKGWAKLISQPKVTTQNNKEAVITNGLRFPVAINQDNTVTIQFFDAALTLTATPQITYEGNIVLDLKVQNNSADFGYSSLTGAPSIRTSESTTTVLVSDGGTTVIGGILQDNDGTSEDKVPGLGSLPVLGHLFKSTSTTRESTEVLFFVTPRVIK